MKPMFVDIKVGDGVSMLLNNNKIDHIFWDDQNELVERLRLLIASQGARNNAHNNEMQAIIEELYESKIIYEPENH